MLSTHRMPFTPFSSHIPMKPKTILGPGLFISQFIGAEPPFDTLGGLAGWAKALGFKALQVPVSDPRLKDLVGLSDKEVVLKIQSIMSKAGLVVSEIAAQRAGALLAEHPAYDQTMDVLAASDVRGRPAQRQGQAAQDLRRAISRAAALGTGKVVAFSGGLAWPYLYPYPPRPAGLVERAFNEQFHREIDRLHGVNAGLDHAGVADHVGIREVDDHQVIFRQPSGDLEGQVVRSDSSPKASAKVLFINAMTGKRQTVTANTAGRFQTDLAAGSWHVYLHGPDEQPIYHSRVDVNGAQSRMVNLVSRSN